MSQPLTLDEAVSMLAVSEAFRAKLLEEKAALLAQPSTLFQPQGPTAEGRQLERDAFAKGFHHAAMSRCSHA